MESKVEVRPIEKQKWHGKKKQENFTRPKKYEVLVDARTRQYATGLTPEEAEKYGQLLGVDLSAIDIPNTPHPFWSTRMAVLNMQNNTMFFNQELPLDFVKVKNMKASKFIANSQKEWEEGIWPDATHVIYDEKQAIEATASKISLRNSATSKAAELSAGRKIEVIMLLLGKNMNSASPNALVVAMDSIVNDFTKEFLDLMNTKAEVLSTQALVKVCIQNHLLHERGHNIYYADSVIGTDVGEVGFYLDKPENQSLKMRLMNQVKEI